MAPEHPDYRVEHFVLNVEEELFSKAHDIQLVEEFLDLKEDTQNRGRDNLGST